MNPNLPSGLWSIWPQLSTLQYLFFLVLCCVGVYCLWSAAVIVIGIRSLGHAKQSEDALSFERRIGTLQSRCANVRQIIGATFLLFGAVLFLGLQAATHVVGDSSTISVEMLVIENLVLHFAFAANVFLILLPLYLLQWFISNRLSSVPLHSSHHYSS